VVVRRYLTPADVARLVGVSATTVTRWAREGKIPCQVTLGGHRRFDPDVIDELARGLRPPDRGATE
jgi:excisionase family DNA binding protein